MVGYAYLDSRLIVRLDFCRLVQLLVGAPEPEIRVPDGPAISDRIPNRPPYSLPDWLIVNSKQLRCASLQDAFRICVKNLPQLSDRTLVFTVDMLVL